MPTAPVRRITDASGSGGLARGRHRVALRTGGLRELVRGTPVALALELLHQLRVALGAHGLGQPVPTAPVRRVTDASGSGGLARGRHWVALRTGGLRECVGGAPVTGAHEPGDQLRVAPGALRLGERVLGAPVCRVGGRWGAGSRLGPRWCRGGFSVLAACRRQHEPQEGGAGEQRHGAHGHLVLHVVVRLVHRSTPASASRSTPASAALSSRSAWVTRASTSSLRMASSSPSCMAPAS